jgi:hypothetical protein
MEGGAAMSEPGAREPASSGVSLERSQQESLEAARPLPPHEEMLIDNLTDEEERIFVEAILNA